MKPSLRHIIELASILGIIASLIFVGMQLSLDRKVAIAEQYSYRTESRLSDFRTELESEAVLDRIAKRWDLGIRPDWWHDGLLPSEYSSRDIATVIISITMSVMTFDNLRFQNEQGLLEDGYWTNSREQLKSMLRSPMGRAAIPNFTNSNAMKELIYQLNIEIDDE